MFFTQDYQAIVRQVGEGLTRFYERQAEDDEVKEDYVYTPQEFKEYCDAIYNGDYFQFAKDWAEIRDGSEAASELAIIKNFDPNFPFQGAHDVGGQWWLLEVADILAQCEEDPDAYRSSILR